MCWREWCAAIVENIMTNWKNRYCLPWDDGNYTEGSELFEAYRVQNELTKIDLLRQESYWLSQRVTAIQREFCIAGMLGLSTLTVGMNYWSENQGYIAQQKDMPKALCGKHCIFRTSSCLVAIRAREDFKIYWAANIIGIIWPKVTIRRYSTVRLALCIGQQPVIRNNYLRFQPSCQLL